MFHANCAPILYKDQNYLQADRTKNPHEPLHQGVPSRASKLVSQPMVHQAQTVYVYCTETNTISKETELRFYMTYAIQEFYWVLPNIFLSIWYVRCNSCTYLASRLALCPNKSKLSFHLSPFTQGVSSGASKMVSQPMMHQAQTVYLSCTKTNSVSEQTKARFYMSRHLGVLLGCV